jgi:hypothetical protein
MTMEVRTMRFSTRQYLLPLAIRVGVAALAIVAVTGLSTMFAPEALACDTYVSGYYRSAGTYVSGHYRSCANSTTWDNWTTRGNVNPYTGQPGTRSPYTYDYSPSYSPSWSSPYSSPSRCHSYFGC